MSENIKSTNHTPGEWIIEENVNHYPFIMAENKLIALLFEGDGSLIYGRTLEETQANAQRIVKCVNLFDDLVSKLKRTKHHLTAYNEDSDLVKGINELLKQAEQ